MTNNLSQLEAIKNKYINGPHAILAWLGALLGFTTIAESIECPYIHSFIRDMIEKEIGPIICAEYPEISNKELSILEETFFERCKASKDDPVTRVGRDPLRKLDKGARIRGTIELAEKHHLNIPTPRLEQGIAAGILYAVKEIDPNNPGCKKIFDIYKNNNNPSFEAVLCYHGSVPPNGTFTGLDPIDDRRLINNVLSAVTSLNQQLIVTNHLANTNQRNNSSSTFINTMGSYLFSLVPETQSINAVSTSAFRNALTRYYRTGCSIWHRNEPESHIVNDQNIQTHPSTKFMTK